MKPLRLGLATLVLVALMPASSAIAQGSGPWCISTWHVSFSPGLGASPQRVAFTNQVRPTALDCFGTLGGHAVTGRGSLIEDGVIDGTALTGTGSGTLTVTIPTTGGPQTINSAFTMSYAPGIGFKAGDAFMGPFTFFFYPTAGNGITAPVTEIAVVGQGILNS